MLRKGLFILGCVSIALVLTACSVVSSTEPVSQATETSLPAALPTTQASEPPAGTATENAVNPVEYEKCGSGALVELPFFFTDVYGNQSPTQIMRSQQTSDGVRRYLSLVTCLVHDQGWMSDANEVEKGYENEIIFFDKYGKAHIYRVIIGGHYIAPYDPGKKDITSSLNGVDKHNFFIADWLQATYDQFTTSGVRQIGVDLYIEDTDGNLSKVLSRVYGFRETNLQIENALRTGEGYPEEVPEGFFLFATESWLVIPE